MCRRSIVAVCLKYRVIIKCPTSHLLRQNLGMHSQDGCERIRRISLSKIRLVEIERQIERQRQFELAQKKGKDWGDACKEFAQIHSLPRKVHEEVTTKP